LSCRVDGGRVDVNTYQRGVKAGRDPASGIILDVPPQARVVVSEAFKAEWPPDSRRHAKSNPGRLDKNRAATAERVEQGFAWVPIGQRQQAGSKIFADRSFAFIEPPPALEQGFSAGIQIKRGRIFRKEEVNPCIGSDGVNVGPASLSHSKPVTDPVFGAQVAVLKAFH